MKKSDITWFKDTFGKSIVDALAGTPVTLNMATAIACQETGYLWAALRKTHTPSEVLALCVGDVIDASGGRNAFPRTKAELLGKPKGDQMFSIARKALEDIAAEGSNGFGYKPSLQNPNKFCHGYGIFQYDLQFFLEDPGYFLNRKWIDFGACLGKFVFEVKEALKSIGWQHKTALTDYEMACVAIAYNTGRFVPAKKLKQGYYSDGKYYGEWIAEYLDLANSVVWSPASGSDGLIAATASAGAVRSYYPHWVRLDGSLDEIGSLPAGTIIAAHHLWDIDQLKEILDKPGKDFQISWYSESNLRETGDEQRPTDRPVVERIADAQEKQSELLQSYSADRFADLFELDAARDKKEGELPQVPGNKAGDWIKDATAVQAAGFKFMAKSPRAGHVAELRQKIGIGFVPRAVFEDVANNSDYRADAIALARAGTPVTLVMHQNVPGQSSSTTLAEARKTIRDYFSETGMVVEAYHGEPAGFTRLLSFPAVGPAAGPVFDSAVAAINDAIGSGGIANTVVSLLNVNVPLSASNAPVVLRAMRLGVQGDLVKKWQAFLLGQGFDPGGLDGDFGDKTAAATKALQAKIGVSVDGIAGQQTQIKAVPLGWEIIEEPANDTSGSNFPPRPNFAPLSGSVARQALFGRFDYVPDPQPDNREQIRILGSWEADNIVRVPLPQLRQALGSAAPASMRFHRLVAAQLQGLWAEWEANGMLGRVLTFDGSFNARFIRGSTSTLSNHAFGSAFDINADLNPLGTRPLLVGTRGSVRELVPIANKWGFYWGGHFGHRPDGMHFEVAFIKT